MSSPNIKPDLVGMDRLPEQAPDTPGFPDATRLLSENGDSDYRIGAGDELVVVIWGRPDLGSQVPAALNGSLRASTVAEDGTIFLPFLGNVSVGGKTLESIRQSVEEGYAGVIQDPQVEVQLRGCHSQSVFLGGAVAKAGAHFLCQQKMTLGRLLTEAGGLSRSAAFSDGVLTRGGQSYRLDYRSTERGESDGMRIRLEDGDVIYFPSTDERYVYVFGEVRRQGLVSIPTEGITLLGALGRVGGLDPIDASHGSIFLIRPAGDDLVTYRLSMADILQSPEVPLGHGDRIFVPPTGLTRWDRFWRKAIPFTTVRTILDVNAVVGGQ